MMDAVRRATAKLGAGPAQVESTRMVEAALGTDLRAGWCEAAAMLAERTGDMLSNADADADADADGLTVPVFDS